MMPARFWGQRPDGYDEFSGWLEQDVDRVVLLESEVLVQTDTHADVYALVSYRTRSGQQRAADLRIRLERDQPTRSWIIAEISEE